MQASGIEQGTKGDDLVIAWSSIDRSGEFIERDKIDQCPQAGNPSDQLLCCCRVIIYPSEQHIADQDTTVIVHRLGQQRRFECCQIMRAIDRHHLRTQRVISSRQTHREVDLMQIQFDHSWKLINSANRRNGDMSPAQLQSRPISEYPHGGRDGVDIVERFAHAHEHHVTWSHAGMSRCRQYLANNFVGRELPHQAHAGGVAKSTPHLAANL